MNGSDYKTMIDGVTSLHPPPPTIYTHYNIAQSKKIALSPPLKCLTLKNLREGGKGGGNEAANGESEF